MEELSWLRLGRAISEVLGRAGGYSVTLRALSWLALLGVAPLAKWLVPQRLLTVSRYGVGLWMATVFVAFILAVHAVYDKQKELDEARDRARKEALLPDSQRQRIHRIKELAASLFTSVLGTGTQLEIGFLQTSVNEIHAEAGRLGDHLGLGAVVSIYTRHLLQLTDDRIDKNQEWKNWFRQELSQYYWVVINHSNHILEEFSVSDT